MSCPHRWKLVITNLQPYVYCERCLKQFKPASGQTLNYTGIVPKPLQEKI
jgi:hypothetical protein